MFALALESPGIVLHFQSWESPQVNGDYPFRDGLLVGLEKLQESSALFVGLPVCWEKFPAEGYFLGLTAVAEVQQCWVEQSRVYVSGFPCHVEILGKFLTRGEAAVEIYSLTA
ncbi:MAG: hypothetical protein OXL37_17345 [Chloroflexota bacterium]|nr:hypothetical protein [Chloroflexota bacterium]